VANYYFNIKYDITNGKVDVFAEACMYMSYYAVKQLSTCTYDMYVSYELRRTQTHLPMAIYNSISTRGNLDDQIASSHLAQKYLVS